MMMTMMIMIIADNVSAEKKALVNLIDKVEEVHKDDFVTTVDVGHWAEVGY